MKIKKALIVIVVFFSVLLLGYKVVTNTNLNSKIEIGTVVDSLNGVDVYFNGGVNQVDERNRTSDGYNVGLKYQCVEFIKRYYLEHYKHKMPDTYGHAKHFFDPSIKHGELNHKRGLWQYRNRGDMKPEVGDILVYKKMITNPYGHVAIVSDVDLEKMQIEIIQQNPGPFSPSRETYSLENDDGDWNIENNRILGWLRLLRGIN